MIYKAVASLAVALALLFTTGAFRIEGRLRGPAIAGILSVSFGGRTVALAAHSYRPNRTYFQLNAR